MDIYFLHAIPLIFGLCIGSFLNVCIYRLPAGKSIVRPGSMCPVCNRTIAPYDNIPVISYLLLGGRCRRCKTSIPLRYPLVELITGLLALGVFMRFGLTAASIIFFIFSAALLVVTFIDIDHQIIPDLITLPGIPVFFVASFFLPHSNLMEPLVRSVLGILAGGGSLYLVAWSYERLTGKEGMGMGDVKLLAMIGALLGWRGVLFTIFAGSSAGCVVGLVLMVKNRGGMKMAVPFGPFLSLGALLYVFWGPRLINWYLNLLN
jgi:leader peptidase (prepilin peptidase) / N-methyltransferase